jgi:hypothetical protein
MVHKKDINNKPISNEELYKMKYNKLSACIHRLCDHLLGENWYIADPVDETTACEIITDEICNNYRDVNKHLFKGKKI